MDELETLQEYTNVGVRMQILIGEAVEWLRKRNLFLDVHFTYENAPETANHLAYLEKVKELKEELDECDEFIPFHGDNLCKITCRGWDGKSNTCDCGDRRVIWGWDYRDDYFKNPTCFGIAK